MTYANQAGQDSKGIWDKIKDQNNANSSNLSAPSKYNNANSNSSNKHINATSHFTAIFTTNVIKYNAQNIKDQLKIRKAIHILKSIIKKPQQNNAYTI